MERSGKVHYLDASALVKLVADDPDAEPERDAIRHYDQQHTTMLTTSYCVSEAFSVKQCSCVFHPTRSYGVPCIVLPTPLSSATLAYTPWPQ